MSQGWGELAGRRGLGSWEAVWKESAGRLQLGTREAMEETSLRVAHFSSSTNGVKDPALFEWLQLGILSEFSLNTEVSNAKDQQGLWW